MRTPNKCPCPLTRGVRLWEVKNAVFERRNRRDHSLCPLMGGVRLREVSVSGGSPVVNKKCRFLTPRAVLFSLQIQVSTKQDSLQHSLALAV